MRLLGFSFISILFLLGCSHKEKTPEPVDYLLSKEPSLLFQIHHKDQFVNQLINNDFWKNYFKYYPNQNVQNLLHSLPQDNNIWVAYTHDGVYLSTSIIQKDSLSPWKNISVEKLDSLTIEDKKWYYITQNNQLLISSLKDISFPKSIESKYLDFHKVAKTISQEVPANLFLAQKKNKEFIGGIFPENLVKNLASWTAWDLFLEKNTLRMSGSSLRRADSLPQLPLVKNKKKTSDIYRIIPQTFQEIFYFSFEEGLIPTEFYFDFQQDISSVSFFSFQGDSLAVLQSINPTETLRYFTILKTDSFQGESIYNIEEFSDIQSFFSIFGKELQPKYIYKNEENLIFSQKKETLEGLINAIQMKQTLSERKAFENLQQKSSSQTSFIAIENLQKNSSFVEKFPSLAQKYGYASLQISPQDEFYLLTFTTTTGEGEGKLAIPQEEGIEERFQITLDKEARTLPKFVTNHRTNKREVVIQDIDNQLYLIGNDGKILWKRRLDAPIVGEIFQVDLFQNGFLQLAFNTEHSLWVIDRNGREVAPFPISYKEAILPLQIFDYERTKDYRFVVCSQNQIHLLDKKANPIKGFEKSHVPNGLGETPKHLRILGKDFIVFPEKEGTLSILHRNGTTRIPLSQKFDFSNNPITLYKDFITFTTRSNKQFYIDGNGGIRSESLGINMPYFFDCLKDIPVILSGNILLLNKKKIELPFAEYDRPTLHWVGNRFLCSVIDTQNNKLYIFNSKGDLLPYFPIFSISQADITSENGKLLLTFLKEKNILSVSQF